MYCQIQLDSGERILISIAQTGVKIFKLSFGGLIPTKTIWESDDIDEMINLFVDPNDPVKQPLDAIKDRLIECKSMQEVKQVLLTPPSDGDRLTLEDDSRSFAIDDIDSNNPENEELNNYLLALQMTGEAARFAMSRDYDSALELFNRVIKLKKDSPDAYLGIAMIHQNRGEIAEAIRLLETAPMEMKLGGEVIKDASLEIYKALGVLYSMIGEKKKAIERLEHALVALENPQVKQQLNGHKKVDEFLASKGDEILFAVNDLEKEIKEMIRELKIG